MSTCRFTSPVSAIAGDAAHRSVRSAPGTAPATGPRFSVSSSLCHCLAAISSDLTFCVSWCVELSMLAGLSIRSAGVVLRMAPCAFVSMIVTGFSCRIKTGSCQLNEHYCHAPRRQQRSPQRWDALFLEGPAPNTRLSAGASELSNALAAQRCRIAVAAREGDRDHAADRPTCTGIRKAGASRPCPRRQKPRVQPGSCGGLVTSAGTGVAAKADGSGRSNDINALAGLGWCGRRDQQ